MEIPGKGGSIKKINDKYIYSLLSGKSFKDENFPLEIAEIELQNETEKLDLPNFLSKEITGLKIFSNFNLAISPFGKWDKKDLRFLKDN